MIANVERSRVWLSKELQKDYKNKFVEITIRNNLQKKSFISKINKDGRFYIPKSIKESMNIKEKVEVVNILNIKNLIKSKKLINNNKIEILTAIPEKTLSGYPIAIKKEGRTYQCWYCAKGRPNEIIINKAIPLTFSRLLGYHQAEGGKPKLSKRRGRTLSFTNKKIELIKDYFQLANYMFNNQLIKATVRHNPKEAKENIENLKKELLKLGITQISIKQAPRIKTFTIKLWVSNSLLAEIVDNLNTKLKQFLLEDEELEIFKDYYRGYLAGDGTFFVGRDKNNSMHAVAYLFEEREEYIKEHQEILNNRGIIGGVKKAKNKNMFILTINCNWNTLLKLLEYDLFKVIPYHKKKLINAIRSHKKFRALKHLASVKGAFNLATLEGTINKEKGYIYGWLRDRKEEGLISKSKENFWKLTKEGIRIKNILNLTSLVSNQDSFQNKFEPC